MASAMIKAAMVVHKADGGMIKFQEYENGLYYHNIAASLTPSNQPVIKCELDAADDANGPPFPTTIRTLAGQQLHHKLPSDLG